MPPLLKKKNKKQKKHVLGPVSKDRLKYTQKFLKIYISLGLYVKT